MHDIKTENASFVLCSQFISGVCVNTMSLVKDC